MIDVERFCAAKVLQEIVQRLANHCLQCNKQLRLQTNKQTTTPKKILCGDETWCQSSCPSGISLQPSAASTGKHKCPSCAQQPVQFVEPATLDHIHQWQVHNFSASIVVPTHDGKPSTCLYHHPDFQTQKHLCNQCLPEK